MYRVWSLDSGAGSGCPNYRGYDCIRKNQIDWIGQEFNKISKDDPSRGKGILFMHIPIQEYLYMFNEGNIVGKAGEEICCQAGNTGLFQVIKDTNGVDWISSCHDHHNDFYGIYKGITMAYGRKTGYGQIGPNGLKKGARVFEISIDPHYQVKTWIRQEDKSIDYQEEYIDKPFIPQTQDYCCVQSDILRFLNYKLIMVILLGITYFLADSLMFRQKQRGRINKNKDSKQCIVAVE
ncbi:UNKNOWN [Stylonychia lemnae]|uniref:Metallophosphoesterase n=1 Tax=Stylonychia lemnae TaxID=5949 RepID=A0A078AX49_STYLE|nr:UNKNOWN [Stylonychia lemnae]|eukprot:CDW85827.1 UNKNOWN [Stylonychia lemnae]